MSKTLIPEFKHIKVANCIAVGGGIAFGKTTLIRGLQKAIPNSIATYELASENGDTTRTQLHDLLLQGLYEGTMPPEWFQLIFCGDRFNKYKEMLSKCLFILDNGEEETKHLIDRDWSNHPQFPTCDNELPNICIGCHNQEIEYYDGLSDEEKKEFGDRPLLNYIKNKIENPLILFDRTIFEDRLFAHQNMLDRPIQFTYYDQLWKDMCNELVYSIGIPKLYILLTGSWETFKQRIYARNRPVEISNFERNEQYFKSLLENYEKFMIGVFNNFGIKYVIINVDNKTKEEVLQEALTQIKIK